MVVNGYGLKMSCVNLNLSIFTARKRSLEQGNVFTGVCDSVQGGGGAWSQRVCLVSGGGCLVPGGYGPSMPCRFSGPHSRGKFRGIWLGGGLQAHTQGGKLRGIWSRPTLKGEVEGYLVQAHTQGGSWGGSGPGPPHPPRDGYCCGRYTSYWNAFLLMFQLVHQGE